MANAISGKAGRNRGIWAASYLGDVETNVGGMYDEGTALRSHRRWGYRL